MAMLFRIVAPPGQSVYNEVFHAREALKRCAASDDSFIIQFSGVNWTDEYKVSCTPGTARQILSDVMTGALNQLVVGGDILEIVGATPPDFYARR